MSTQTGPRPPQGRSGHGAAAVERRWLVPLLASLTLGLAPFVPEPHLVGKLRWIVGGGAGMTAVDVFDLVIHGAPWLWLAWALGPGRVRSGASSGSA